MGINVCACTLCVFVESVCWIPVGFGYCVIQFDKVYYFCAQILCFIPKMDNDDFFIFEIHFGGRFKNLNDLVYVNGDVTAHDEPFDSDCLSIFQLESILGKYRYQRGDLIYYKLADMSLDTGLVLLKTDADHCIKVGGLEFKLCHHFLRV